MTESPPTHHSEPKGVMRAALLLPFAYFFLTRVPTAREKFGWLFSYVVPVLALSALGHRAWSSLPIALLAIIAIYAAYEFGYIVNDTAAADREASPTHRLSPRTRRWFRDRLPWALAVRFVFGGACIAIVATARPSMSLAIGLIWLAIWPVFALYNWRRGRITLLLYLLLVSIRYLLPIWATGDETDAVPSEWLLFLVYPLPNTIVAAWKPRYSLDFLQEPFGNEHRFRVVWYVALLLLSLLGVWLAPQWVTWPFVAVCAYYFAARLLSLYERRVAGKESALRLQSSNPGAARVALSNMAWILGDKAMAMVLGLLIFGMIGRALGPVGAGHFAFAAALLQVALGLSLVCSASALLPRFCRMNAALPGAIANVFVVRMAASVASFAAVSLYCLLVIDSPERRTVSMVMLLAVPLIEPFAVIAMYWNSRNHNRPNVISRTFGLLARTAAVAIGLALGAAWWMLAMAWVLEAAIGALVQTRQLRQALPGRRFSRFLRKPRSPPTCALARALSSARGCMCSTRGSTGCCWASACRPNCSACTPRPCS